MKALPTPVNVFVCVTCQAGADKSERPGIRMHAQLEAALTGNDAIRLHQVECLCICTRPCTIAVSSPGKWSYIIAGLDAAAHANDVCDYVNAYAASEHGTPPFKERPASIRRGTAARLPPLAG